MRNHFSRAANKQNTGFSFSNVSLLLDGKGANNSTTFTDKSSSPKTVTPFGDAKISTAIADPFGATEGVMRFDGTGDYLRVAASSAFSFGGDFTVEFWARVSIYSAVGIYTNNSVGTWSGFHIDDSRIEVTGVGSVDYPNGALAINSWVFCTLARSGTSLVFYRNGIAEITRTSSGTFGDGTNSPGIGLLDSYGGAPRAFYNGYLAQLRVTKGFALYTANFTPPSGPFPQS